MNAFDDIGGVSVLPAFETENEVVADLAIAATAAETLDPEVPQAIVVPRGAKLELPDLSWWRDRPHRKTGVYRPATVLAFIDYVANQHVDGDTTVWVHPTSGQITAVIDDSGAEPGYRQHRVELLLAPTPEWSYWAAQDGKMLPQLAFAEHIEGGLQQIEQPDAADVLELAQSFHATTAVTFRSSTRLATGEQQLQYDEETAATAGRTGQLNVPTAIVLVLAPFIGEQEVQIAARFRFRVNSGHLQLGYKLDQPEKVVRDAIETIAERIAGRFARTYLGEAPAAA